MTIETIEGLTVGVSPVAGGFRFDVQRGEDGQPVPLLPGDKVLSHTETVCIRAPRTPAVDRAAVQVMKRVIARWP